MRGGTLKAAKAKAAKGRRMNAETMPAGGLVPDSTYVDVDKVPWLKTRFPASRPRR
jgi:hypothetical protein